MNKRIFIFLFIIGALCLCGCADDFATKINLDGNSSEGEFNSEAALYGTVQDNYGKPIAGVLVSDGMQTTETDAKGNWQLFSQNFKSISISGGLQVTGTKNMIFFTIVWALEIRIIFDQSQNRNLHHGCHFYSFTDDHRN